jgi:hypothetical protein
MKWLISISSEMKRILVQPTTGLEFNIWKYLCLQQNHQ